MPNASRATDMPGAPGPFRAVSLGLSIASYLHSIRWNNVKGDS